MLRWRKRKWLCPSIVCDRKVFTEAVPGVPARVRVTPRAKAEMAIPVLDEDRSVTAVAEAALDADPAAVRVFGIDETRRDKAKWDTDPDTGTRIWADR